MKSSLSKELALSFRPEPPEHLEEYCSLLVKELGVSGVRLMDSDIPSRVSLGFIGGDWELGTKDEYYVEVGMARPAFDRLYTLLDQGESRQLDSPRAS